MEVSMLTRVRFFVFWVLGAGLFLTTLIGVCSADLFFMADGTVIRGNIVSHKKGKFTVKTEKEKVKLSSDKIDCIIPGDEFSSQNKVLSVLWEASKKKNIKIMKSCLSKKFIKSYKQIADEDIDEWLEGFIQDPAYIFAHFEFSAVKEDNKFKVALEKNEILKFLEDRTKWNLDILKSAITIYYSYNEGLFPGKNISKDLVPEYLTMIPPCEILKYHKKSNEITVVEHVDKKSWPK